MGGNTYRHRGPLPLLGHCHTAMTTRLLLAAVTAACLTSASAGKLLSLTTLTDGIFPIILANFSDGFSGIGQASYGGDAETTALIVSSFHSLVAKYAIGRNISSVSDITSLQADILWESYKTTGGLLTRALAGLDTALFDYLGKATNTSVCGLLGGGAACSQSVRIYGSSTSRVLTPTEIAQKIAFTRATYGVNNFKIKIAQRMGHDKDVYPGRTAEIITGVRAACPGCTLAADANGGYDSLTTAQPVAQLLHAQNYSWFEEPVPWWDYQTAASVAALGLLPVALGEQEFR